MMPAPSRTIVVVPYYWPPFAGSGNRWPTLAKYLRRRGHRVIVLATDAYGVLEDDQMEDVVRIGDLRSSKVARRALGRGDLTAAGEGDAEVEAGAILTKVFVPDIYS